MSAKKESTKDEKKKQGMYVNTSYLFYQLKKRTLIQHKPKLFIGYNVLAIDQSGGMCCGDC